MVFFSLLSGCSMIQCALFFNVPISVSELITCRLAGFFGASVCVGVGVGSGHISWDGYRCLCYVLCVSFLGVICRDL